MYKIPEIRALDLREAQTRFIQLMNRLSLGKKDRIIAVFDGKRGNQTRIGKLDVYFSGSGENADSVIKRMSEGYTRHEIIIVSSDRELLSYARLGGQEVMSAEDFIQRFLIENEQDSESERIKSLEKNPTDYWLKVFQQKGGLNA
ncbi:MAG TPA: hypothetical protein ENN84_02130 [Candidatus Marinimicrobia bacterium]|nr:hypothetical protein [Candidatus Neomarinimicrobiota bacterium]